MYHYGITRADKEKADLIFLENMLKLIDNSWWGLRFLRRSRAKKYYKFVDLFGWGAFKNKKINI